MELLSVFILWLRPAFWSRVVIVYLVLSAFTSSPISLVATTRASAFSFRVCMLPPNILSSAQWCVPFNFKPFWFTWTMNICRINRSWKQYVSYSNCSFYSAQLLGHLSGIRILDSRLHCGWLWSQIYLKAFGRICYNMYYVSVDILRLHLRHVLWCVSFTSTHFPGPDTSMTYWKKNVLNEFSYVSINCSCCVLYFICTRHDWLRESC